MLLSSKDVIKILLNNFHAFQYINLCLFVSFRFPFVGLHIKYVCVGFASTMVIPMSLIGFFTSQEGVLVKPPRLSIWVKIFLLVKWLSILPFIFLILDSHVHLIKLCYLQASTLHSVKETLPIMNTYKLVRAEMWVSTRFLCLKQR